MKRLFDLFFALIILLLFFPVGLILSVWIALESRGGVFYSQERIGLDGVKFNLLKFRSMRKDADKLGKLTVGMRDPRITKSGVFIRKFKLDEFPQFLNVLKGEMSVVGPRPEVKEYVDLYSSEQLRVLSVKPGITDFASLKYFEENKLLGESDNPTETYIHEIMPAKLSINLEYVDNHSFVQDIKIIGQTFLKIIK